MIILKERMWGAEKQQGFPGQRSSFFSQAINKLGLYIAKITSLELLGDYLLDLPLTSMDYRAFQEDSF